MYRWVDTVWPKKGQSGTFRMQVQNTQTLPYVKELVFALTCSGYAKISGVSACTKAWTLGPSLVPLFAPEPPGETFTNYLPQTKFGARQCFYTCVSFCSGGRGSAQPHAGQTPWDWTDLPGCRPPMVGQTPPECRPPGLGITLHQGWAYPPGVGQTSLMQTLLGLGRTLWIQIPGVGQTPLDADPPYADPLDPDPQHWAYPHTVNKWVVCILLECILVCFLFLVAPAESRATYLLTIVSVFLYICLLGCLHVDSYANYWHKMALLVYLF